MLPKGVLFDFDGVIVDSLPIHVAAWSEATKQLFGRTLTYSEKRRIIGRSTGAIGHIIASEFFGSENAERLMALKKACIVDMGYEAGLYPGVRELHAWLRESKIPFGIASNAPGEYVRQVVEKLQLQVDVVLGVEDVAQPKPAPDMYLLCSKRLGISVSDHPRVMVFEDSVHGLKAGVDAGMHAVGIGTTHDEKTFLDAGAQLYFKSLKSAADYLMNQSQ